MGSYLDEYPQSSRSTMYLAYQNSDEYPELLEDLQNTISQRNKSRIQHTMRQFEYLSNNNKNIDKSVFAEDDRNYNDQNNNENEQRYNHSSRCCRKHGNNCQVCDYCPNFYECRKVFESNQPSNDYRTHRSRRYTDLNSNRCVDPSWSDSQLKNGQQRSLSNSRWQMDPRSGSWIKMYDNARYDFRDYPSYQYQETNYHNNCSSKMLPSKLHHYFSRQRHRSGSRKRFHENSNNVCTCHHCTEYRH
nr:GATA zinc finger domain-containing protein 14-like [Onthophagus taurus]